MNNEDKHMVSRLCEFVYVFSGHYWSWNDENNKDMNMASPPCVYGNVQSNESAEQ